jgi:poly-gamma-glutamate capsule biosynthesis protein CapA/YwtB (metallophosphatase superfamily)
VTPPKTLRQAGFNLLSLANNHTLDYGPSGLAETAMRLQQAGLLAVGTGRRPGRADFQLFSMLLTCYFFEGND